MVGYISTLMRHHYKRYNVHFLIFLFPCHIYGLGFRYPWLIPSWYQIFLNMSSAASRPVMLGECSGRIPTKASMRKNKSSSGVRLLIEKVRWQVVAPL